MRRSLNRHSAGAGEKLAPAPSGTLRDLFVSHPQEDCSMAVDIKDLFDNKLPAAIAANPDKAKEIGHVFQMNITGDSGGSWTIDATASGPSCKPGTVTTAECTITIADADFQKLSENPQANGMQLFFAGKLKVAGNQMLATKLGKLFDLVK